MRIGVTVLALLAFVAADASAHKGKRRTKKKGTFFITEISAGATFGTGFSEQSAGMSTRATMGIGGAFRGFKPRFYFIGAFRYANLSADVERGTLRSEITRELVDVSAGLRVLVPIRRLRILGEITFGDSIVFSEARVNGIDSFSASDSRFTVYLATGLQYRLHRNLSIGINAEWALPTARATQDFVAEVSRVTDTDEMMGWTSASATVVVHF